MSQLDPQFEKVINDVLSDSYRQVTWTKYDSFWLLVHIIAVILGSKMLYVDINEGASLVCIVGDFLITCGCFYGVLSSVKTAKVEIK